MLLQIFAACPPPDVPARTTARAMAAGIASMAANRPPSQPTMKDKVPSLGARRTAGFGRICRSGIRLPLASAATARALDVNGRTVDQQGSARRWAGCPRIDAPAHGPRRQHGGDHRLQRPCTASAAEDAASQPAATPCHKLRIEIEGHH